MLIFTPPSIHDAFIVSSYALEKLIKLLRHSTKIFFDVYFTNGEERLSISFEELLNLENSRRKHIVRLILKARSASEDVFIDFNMNGRLGKGTISYGVTNKEGVEVGHADEIAEVLEGLVPWYSFLTWLSPLWLITVPLLIFAIWILPISHVVWTTFHQTDWLVWVVISRLALPSILSIITGYVLYRFWKWTFPIGVFQIGQERVREPIREMYRTVLVLGLVVSVAAGLFTSLV